ncbi:MAG: glycoside hydrolase family 20 zincin-like fold domain-containing protein, partial [Phycisphaerae bacterium]
MSYRTCPLALLAATVLFAAADDAAGSDAGAPVLFDAGRDAPSAIRHYTAKWIEGSNLEPVARRVEADGRAWIEIRYRGARGTACSTLQVEKVPAPPAGRRWKGLEVLLACDRDDFPAVRVSCGFDDKTILVKRLHLERGVHTYPVVRGFRRAVFPPRWRRLEHVMLRTEAGGEGTDLAFRLGRVRLVSEPAPPPPPKETADEVLAEPLVWPRPKRAAWRDATCETAALAAIHLPAGATDRTVRTAEILAGDLRGYAAVRPEIERFEGDPPARGIVLGIAERVTAFGAPAALKPEGYHLRIAPRRAVLTGADEPGLYYATVTLLQLVRGARRPRPAVPCGEVLDRPSWPNRMARFAHPWTFRNGTIREDRGIAYLLDWTDRFVAGMKFNTLYIDVSALVRFERRPEFNGSERLYSLDDLRRLARLARDRFLRLCPAMAVGGHANHWLLRYHPELTEKGWPRQADVTHPKHDAIVLDCMADLCDALDLAYFSPKRDEWWQA